MDTSTALEASPSSSPSSSSSTTSSSSPYDVFLSFGEDTRKTFTDHLYWTMKDAGIDFFMEENESIRRGENISEKVKQIIQGSKVSVIVFSSRYAYSIWCLEELVQIMECRRTQQIVLPIFYDLSPSDAVGTFAQAFQKHRKRFHKDADEEEKIQRWTDALTKAADLTTWVFRTTNGYEGVFIRKIIDEITRRLNSPIPIGTGFSELQEIDSPVLKLEDGHSSMPDRWAVLPTEPFTSRTFSDCGKDHGSKISVKMGGAGELVAGAAVGAMLTVLFTVLDEVVKDVKDKTMMFREPLGYLDSTLEALKPLIKDIAKYKEVLDQSNKEVEKIVKQMANGEKLLLKCYKLNWWKRFKKYKYAKQLLDLDKCLNRLLKVLTVEGIRKGFENLAVSRENLAVSKETLTTVQKKGLVGNKENVVIQGQERFHDLGYLGSFPEPLHVTVGLDEPLRDLKEMLLKDDVPMLVLTATAGCGKTTLAMKFCQDEEVKDKFKKNIFFVTISKEPNLDVVQELYQHMKSQEAGQDPLLLVLDDVWFKSKSLLQKFDELKSRNYKILVTSRSEFPGFGAPYNLKALKDEDSMTLLRHSASLGDCSSVPEDLLRKILKHCKGVPLAITVTGKSLRGQATEFWRSRLADWCKGSSILDTETELLLRLQSSIDALDDKEAIIKECFMDLVSFPENQIISAAAFIDMWTELYKLDEDVLSIKNLHELASRGLANLVITRKENVEILDNHYIEHFVSQHDMLRELAIYNAKLDPIEDRKRLIVVSGHNQPKWLTEQKSQPINARLLSISSDGMFPTQWQSVHLPQVEVLVLNFKTVNNALPEIVQKFDKLKVLIVTKYGLLPTELSNFDLLESLSNLKRIRLERISIHSITKNIVPLKSLKKISLFMCNMGQAFHNCSIKISDAWPGLEEMNIDYCNDLVELPAELCDLVHMKMLSITNCRQLSALPEEIGKLENLDALRLRSCTELVRLPVSIEKLTKLSCLDMYNCIGIKKLPEGIGNMSGLRKINIGQCLRLEELPLSVWDLDEQLEEVICDEERKHLWESFLAEDKIKVAKLETNLNWLEKPQL